MANGLPLGNRLVVAGAYDLGRIDAYMGFSATVLDGLVSLVACYAGQRAGRIHEAASIHSGGSSWPTAQNNRILTFDKDMNFVDEWRTLAG
jgi:hypothetical protein